MAMMSIKMVNTGRVVHKMLNVERAIAAMPGLTERLVAEVGRETLLALQEATPVGIGRTGGHLAESYTEEVQGDIAVLLTNQARKFAWVTGGTMYADPIHPVIAKALWWPEAAHPYAWVHGQEANDFAQRVFDDIQQYIDTVVPQFVEQLVAIIDS